MKVGVILCLVLVIFASFIGYVTHVNACCGGGVAFGYHSATNPVSPVSPTCDANVAHTVYSYSLASSTTVNLNTATCTAGQDLIFIYKQTAGGVVITYSNTGVIEDWKANCDNTGTCNQPALSGNGDTDIFKFEYNTLPATPVFHEIGQALNVTPNFIVNQMTTLGDILYGGANGAPTRLAGNTGTIPQELNSIGSAGAATAPAFTTLPIFDVEINDTVTGTTVNKLAKQSAGKWIVATTSDLTKPLDLVNYNAGTTGSAGIITAGAGTLIFDGAITQDDAFGESSTAGGQGHDLGTLATACGSATVKVLGTITAATNATPGSTPQAIKMNLSACTQGVTSGWQFGGYSSAGVSIALGGVNQLWLNCYANSTTINVKHIAIPITTADAVTTNFYDACIYSAAGVLINDWANNTAGGAAHGVNLTSGGLVNGIENPTLTVTGTVSGNFCAAVTGTATTAAMGIIANANFLATLVNNDGYATTTNGLCPTSITAPTFAPTSALADILNPIVY